MERDRLGDKLFHFLPRVAAFGFPATVTLPGFVGCSYCRWLPRCSTKRQPSFSMSRTRSRNFTSLIVHCASVDVVNPGNC